MFEIIAVPIIIVAAIGLVAGLGLALASKYLSEPVDPKVAEIRECLPGANCGGCGYAGCDEYASAVAAGEAEPNCCAPGGTETASKLSEVLGVAVSAVEKKATVLCNGNFENAKLKFTYKGYDSCAAASLLYKGPKSCQYACLGYGDCAKVCDAGAIKVTDGVAEIDKDLCGACGKCIAVCPKNVIALLEQTAAPTVLCSNVQKGAVTIKACATGCIGCGKCVKACPSGAIKVENFLAKIDPALCTGCRECVEACPKHIIF